MFSFEEFLMIFIIYFNYITLLPNYLDQLLSYSIVSRIIRKKRHYKSKEEKVIIYKNIPLNLNQMICDLM